MKISYGGWTALATTFTSQSTGTAASTSVIDNTSTLADDYLIACEFTTTGTITQPAVVNIWVAALMDGTHYSAGATASSSFTMPTYKTQLKLGDVIQINTTGTVEYGKVFSVANLFGGLCPDKFIIIVDNETGASFASSSAGSVNYNAVTYTQGGSA